MCEQGLHPRGAKPTINTVMRDSSAARWIEGFGSGLLLSLCGLLRPGDPVFAGFCYMPQVLLPVILASLLGAPPGACALLGEVLASLALPALSRALGLGLGALDFRLLFETARVPAAASLLCAVAAGFARDSAEKSKERLLGRVRDMAHKNIQLEKVNDALKSLSDELERRVSGQRDSISALYARTRKMDSLDVSKVLAGLIESVTAFSQADAAAIYEYDRDGKDLVLRASIGPEPERRLPIDGCIEGWVFRNDSLFSLRMLDEYLNLSRIDVGRSVLAYPLKSGDLPWGVLNIQEMPFYRYNLVTEKNLGVVVALAAPYIKRAADFRDQILTQPRNEITGLPGYGELTRLIGEELTRRVPRRLSISVVIAEILDFDKLVFAHSGPKAFALLKEFVDVASGESRVRAFHYREDGQVAFVLPDLDRDGASLFCLSLTENTGAHAWLVDGESLRIETAFGLAAFPGAAKKVALGAFDSGSPRGAPEGGAEDLLAEAEQVLELSKGAFAGRGEGPR